MATSFSGGRSRSTQRTTDHGQTTGKLYHLRLRVECTLFCNLQILVIAVNSITNPYHTMANNAKTHVEISNQESKLILRSYLKHSNNWMAIRNDIRKQVDLLPPVARNLHESGQFTKVKRRMSDQIKKLENQSYVPKCEEVRRMVAEIKLRNQRYLTKEHPKQKGILQKRKVT